MLQLATDENFNGDIVRGLLFRLPDLNLVRVQDIGLEGAIDPMVLAEAARNSGLSFGLHFNQTQTHHARGRTGE